VDWEVLSVLIPNFPALEMLEHNVSLLESYIEAMPKERSEEKKRILGRRLGDSCTIALRRECSAKEQSRNGFKSRR
jgi:hypothetical protein